MQYCFSQHLTLLSLPDTSTTGCHFCFGSASSLLLKPFLRSSLVVYWTPTELVGVEEGVVHLSVSYLFIFSYSSWPSQGKNAEVVSYNLIIPGIFSYSSLASFFFFFKTVTFFSMFTQFLSPNINFMSFLLDKIVHSSFFQIKTQYYLAAPWIYTSYSESG